jgi:hypothetical protein
LSELVSTRIRTTAGKLGLPHLAEALNQYAQRADEAKMGYLDFLDLVLSEELAVRDDRRFRQGLRLSKLPHHKTLDDYDFSFQSDLDPRKVKDLATLSFVEAKANAAGAGGGLIEAVIGRVDGVQAVRQLIKVPRPGGHGQVFLGTWTVARAGCSTVLKVQAAEGGMTGMREAMIMAEVGPDQYFRPHPYGDGEQFGGLPYHVADHEEWDGRFPDHPLTRVRATLRRLTPTITLDDRFKALPPFTGPAATPA